jgi:CHAT domain-containing protein
MEKAEARYLDWNGKKQAQIQRYFPFLSDNEKTQFYENTLSATQEEFKSFCIARYAAKRAIAADLYNDQLATKGLLLNSSAKWKHRIKTAGDKKLNRLYDDWEMSQNKLNKLIQSTDSTERAGIDSVQAKTEKMEKELSLRSENFAKLADKKLINWKDVQKALKPGEAAVEMIRVQKFGIKKTVTDTSDPKKTVYKVKGLTDTIYYAALIVKPESLIPEMVLLKNGNDLEGKYLKFYQNAVNGKVIDEKSYQQFWEKIGTRLGTSNRVYFSPDGVFHNINLNTLFNPKTKKYLLEEKDIRIVTATKDLVNPSPAEEENKLAELVGFPSFYANSPTASVSTTERKSPEMSYGLRLESVGTLAELPGTKTEVDKIAGILESKGWEVKNYTGSSALEANIKESYKPRLLHIATHGFFQPDTTKGSNPLLRSGLMLTGAGSTLKGVKNEGEDGILTAYEAMNLNLDNTDLVVLSACETGLGEVKNGEGVYGLQRAFKVAGTRSLIMSLWKVNDEATQELMVSFYKHWLAGTSKRAAFLKAQKELKVKYPNPYYWGAFVLVGE